MAFAKITLVCVVLALFAVVNAEDKQLKCYQCAPPDGCNDYSDKKAEDCPGEYNKDNKCYILDAKDKWIRGCTNGADVCAPFTGDNKDKCSTCDKDECNSGTSLTASVFLSSVAFILMKLYN